MNENRTLMESVAASLEAGDMPAAVDALTRAHPRDAADAFLCLAENHQATLLDQLETEAIAALLDEMSDEDAARIAKRLSPARLPTVLQQMYSDEAADLLRTLPPEEIEGLLSQLGTEEMNLRRLLQHAEETSGGLMTTEYIAVREQATVAQAFQYLRTKAPDAETAYYLYVVDNQRRLVGILSLRDLVIAQPDQKVKELMSTDVIRVREDEDQEEVARIFERYGFLTLPVVDAEDRMVGIITIDDVLEVVQSEATEDMYRMVGLVDGESIHSPTLVSVRKRLPWLFVNLATASLAGWTVSLFEGTLARAVVLTTFMPIVAGVGGNAGTQTLTIIVRSLALGEVTFGQVKQVLQRQILLGIVNGAVLGLAVGLLGYLWKGDAVLGLVIGLALILNMAVAGLVGVAVPMGLKALRIDPALASGIFVTMCTDVLGFFFFLGLASLVLTRLQ